MILHSLCTRIQFPMYGISSWIYLQKINLQDIFIVAMSTNTLVHVYTTKVLKRSPRSGNAVTCAWCTCPEPGSRLCRLGSHTIPCPSANHAGSAVHHCTLSSTLPTYTNIGYNETHTAIHMHMLSNEVNMVLITLTFFQKINYYESDSIFVVTLISSKFFIYLVDTISLKIYIYICTNQVHFQKNTNFLACHCMFFQHTTQTHTRVNMRC